VTAYLKLAKLIVFSFADVEELTHNKKTSYSLVNRMIHKGLVKKIKSDLFSCVNPATGDVFASKFQIACKSSATAYISHHSAFEYYGIKNQISYEVIASSKNPFKQFEFEGMSYKCISSKIDVGIIQPNHSELIRVTDLERTVVDSIKDMDKTGGLEELLNCLSLLHFLDAEKLKIYLDVYGTQALYQKTGLLLEHYAKELQIPAAFLEYCSSKIDKSTRYLSKELIHNGVYSSKWRLVVPVGLFKITEQGGSEFV